MIYNLFFTILLTNCFSILFTICFYNLFLQFVFCLDLYIQKCNIFIDMRKKGRNSPHAPSLFCNWFFPQLKCKSFRGDFSKKRRLKIFFSHPTMPVYFQLSHTWRKYYFRFTVYCPVFQCSRREFIFLISLGKLFSSFPNDKIFLFH